METYIIGITGASGSAYALRISDALLESGAALRVVATDTGRRVLEYETGVSLEHWAGERPNAVLEDNADLLPKGAETVEIEGGNHAGFGAYGPQSGDGEASITPAEQQSQTADAIDRYIRARYAEPSLAAAA